MDVSSPAASIWWTFWTRYLTDTFGPWWTAAHVPITRYPALAVGPDQNSLDEDVETWTLHDPHNPAFTPPGSTRRDASTVMLQAFAETMALQSIPSLLGAAPLGYDPRARLADDHRLGQ
jgi:penicillin amidase